MPYTVSEDSGSGIPKKCDLLVVTVERGTYLVSAPTGAAKAYDLVEFAPRGFDILTGRVEDVMTCETFGEIYCFVGRLSQICDAKTIYSKSWEKPKPNARN